MAKSASILFYMYKIFPYLYLYIHHSSHIYSSFIPKSLFLNQSHGHKSSSVMQTENLSPFYNKKQWCITKTEFISKKSFHKKILVSQSSFSNSELKWLCFSAGLFFMLGRCPNLLKGLQNSETLDDSRF